MIDIYTVDLLNLMPESLKSDPGVQALCDAITPEIQAISNEIVQCVLLARAKKLSGWNDAIFQDETYNLDDAVTWDDAVNGEELINYFFNTTLIVALGDITEEVLDILAWQLHVDFYDATLPVETKRELVKNSLRWHKRKGTPAAVEELVTAVFGDGKVLEWFEYGGDPYHFKVQTFNLSVTQGDADKFTRALNSVKNTRSWFDGVEVTISDNLPFYLAGVVYAGDNLTIEQVV